MAAATPAETVGQLLLALQQPAALIEIGVAAGCVLLAAAIAWLLRGRVARSGSILFGDKVFDGVLFPTLALLFAYVANRSVLAGVPTAVFQVVLPILTSLVVIRLTVRVLHVAFPDWGFMRMVERSVSWIAWLAVVLWVTGVLPLVLQELDGIRWKIGESQLSVRNLIEGTLSAVAVLLLALWLSAAIEARLLKNATGNLSVRKMAANAVRALLLLVGLLMALSAAGIDLTALGVLGGALGVGIGLGLQKLASNYVSGFVVLAERSVRIGDMVKVDGFEGRITDINTRYTMIRALNGRESIVPNEMMVTQRVENSSLADPKVAISTVLQVAYGTDIETLRPALLAAILEVPRVLSEPGPGVQLQAFAADGLELNVVFWIGDPQNGQGNVRSDVNLALLRTLNTMGVEIPFPQRVLRRAAPQLRRGGEDAGT